MLRGRMKRCIAYLCTVFLLFSGLYGNVGFVQATGESEAAASASPDIVSVAESEEESAVEDEPEVKAVGEDPYEEIPLISVGDQIDYILDNWVVDAPPFTLYDENGSEYATLEVKFVDEELLGKLTICKERDLVNVTYEKLKDKIYSVDFEPNSIAKAMAPEVFKGFTNLRRVDLTNAKSLTMIQSSAFSGCTKLTSVTLNDELQYIWVKTFENCTSLEEITLNRDLTQLQSEAFSGCGKLKKVKILATNLVCTGNKGEGNASNIFKGCMIQEFELAAQENPSSDGVVVPPFLFKGAGFDPDATLTIPSSVQEVGESAFQGASGLVNLRFEAGSRLTTIGKNAFNACTSLKDVVFPAGLTTIYETAFSGCKAIEEVVIPDKVTKMGKQAFYNCLSMNKLTLSNGTTNSSDFGDGMFQNCKALEVVVIPAGLTFIGNSEFKDCKALATVTIPDSVTEIGTSAFEGCEKLPSVELPPRITEIKASTFKNCKALETAAMPEGVTTIGNSAFEGCEKLTLNSFPNSLETIGSSAYYKCKAITSLTIPGNVKLIGANAFYDCSSLGELIINSSKIGTGNKQCGQGIFCGCSIKSITLPGDITRVPDNLFSKLNKPVSNEDDSKKKAYPRFVIPRTVSSVGNGAFDEANILEIVFENGSAPVSIGDNAFRKCTELTSFQIPATVTEIGEGAFSGCTGLTVMKLPPLITEIRDETFKGCTNLVTAEVPEGVTAIGEAAFSGCALLTSNKLPNSLLTIGNSAYEGCTSFTSLTIPENVTMIDTLAFYGCIGIGTLTFTSLSPDLKCGTGIFNSCLLREVVFPEGITAIPANLFNQAHFADHTFVIPRTVKSIGNGAFGAPKQGIFVNLVSIVFEEGSELETIGNNAFQNCASMEEFDIPATVTSIGTSAFEGCVKLAKIVIPENVTQIGASAFSGCSILTDIEFNAIRVTTANKNIFAKCNVRNITIGPKVSAFPAHLFEGAQFATSDEGGIIYITINVPASVEEIGDFALPNITNLQKVTFEEGSILKRIGKNSFQNCPALTVFNMPDAVEVIDEYAFFGCTLLGSDGTAPFKLPGSLKTIGQRAFKGCASITEALISVYVESIPAEAFSGCTKLGRTLILDFVTEIGDGAFDGCTSAQFYVVPDSHADKWFREKGFAAQINLLTPVSYVLNGGDKATKGYNPGGYGPGWFEFDFTEAIRPGFNFLGWFTDEALTKPITGVRGLNGPVTAYAKWEKAVYKITYVMNGGTNHPDNPLTYTIDDVADQAITFKDPTWEGFKFEGWYTDPEYKNRIKAIAVGSYGDLTLYAKWRGKTAVEPTANIESGSVVKAGTRVRLTTSTKGASIYYTVDGSYPTVESTLYKNGIVIDRSMTIKAIAAGPGFIPSPVVAFRYDLLDEKEDWGEVYPEDQKRFTDATMIPDGIWVAGVHDVEYNGQAQTFDVRVYDNKTLLVQGRDYTLKYSNNKNSGLETAGKKAPFVTVKAKGNYKGNVVKKFTISANSISGNDYEADTIYAGSSDNIQKIVPLLWHGSTKLRNKKDYRVIFPSGGTLSPGTYKVGIEGTGNYTGKKEIDLVVGSGTSLAKAKVKGVVAKVYTGEAVTQNPVVTVDGVILAYGQDYDLVYRNNVESGKAVMTVVGKGSYSGMKTVYFNISPKAKISKASFTYNTTLSYNGETLSTNLLDFKAVYEGKQLVEGAEYSLELQKNRDAGKALLLITGRGPYLGTVKKNVKIEAVDVTYLTCRLLDENGLEQDAGSYPYEMGGPKPGIAVYFGDRLLCQGSDYTLSYSTDKTGKGDIVVTGKKNFRNTRKVPVTIDKKDISDLAIIGSGVPYRTAAGAISSAWVSARDANGRLLVLDTDYSVKYTYATETAINGGKVKKANEEVKVTDVIPEGAIIRATLTGKGKYTGTGVTDMTVYRNSISKAKVTIPPQVYTGQAIRPDVSQMTVTLGKNGSLGKNDFEIIDYSNNIKKGTAQVTLKGMGDYGSVKVASFKITARQFEMADK